MKKTTLILIVLLGGTALLFYWLMQRFPDALSGRNGKVNFVNGVALLSYFILVLVQRRLPLQKSLQHIVVWLGVLFFAVAGYTYWPMVKSGWRPIQSQLIPGVGQSAGLDTMEFPLSSNGHYMIEARVEGRPIRFMVDSGASRVVLSEDDAARLGINPAHLTYNMPTQTANGIVYSAPVRLKDIEVGSIVVQDVEASVSRDDLGGSLLGMSFLSKLSSWRVENGVLLLKQ